MLPGRIYADSFLLCCYFFFFFFKHGLDSWKSYDRTNQDTIQQREQQNKEETPTEGWREKVDGDGQTRDACNDEG